MASNLKNSVTRRGFLERSVGALATVGVLAGVGSAATTEELGRRANTAKDDAVPTSGKIALEEHFVIPETLGASFAASGPPEFQRRIEEIGSERIAAMDRGGGELCIL